MNGNDYVCTLACYMAPVMVTMAMVSRPASTAYCWAAYCLRQSAGKRAGLEGKRLRVKAETVGYCDGGASYCGPSQVYGSARFAEGIWRLTSDFL